MAKTLWIHFVLFFTLYSVEILLYIILAYIFYCCKTDKQLVEKDVSHLAAVKLVIICLGKRIVDIKLYPIVLLQKLR
jgi:hypothetical protein